MNHYKEWLKKAPAEVKEQLKKLTKEQIKDQFDTDIKFGTAGMRGKMKLGTSYINEYTIGRAAFAYGQFLLKTHPKASKTNGIIIAHDNRKNRELYSRLSAEIISAMGIPVFLFKNNDLQPTPLLSFTIAKGNYVGGINITASHNPPSDNGFKVYDEHGKQLDSSDTNIIQSNINNIKNIFKIPRNEKNINYLDDSIVNYYIDYLLRNIPNKNHINKSAKHLNVVFTPQHGTSLTIAKKIMEDMDVNYTIVKEQATPDENFSNTESPNPQNLDSFILAREYGDKNKADVIFGTDPDADRFGVEIKHKGSWIHINGNQLPIIQLYWQLKNLKKSHLLNDDYFAIRSVVTSDFGDKICNDFNIPMYETLTGFKNIVKKILSEESKSKKLVFAYEESYGSILNSCTRDKDSFQALIQVIEIAATLKEKKKTLWDLFSKLENKYGYHFSEQKMIRLEGEEGFNEMKDIIQKFKNLKIGDTLADMKITDLIDYSKGYNNLPKENFVKIQMGENSYYIRPSGTEPILRIYCYAYAKTKKDAYAILHNLLSIL